MLTRAWQQIKLTPVLGLLYSTLICFSNTSASETTVYVAKKIITMASPEAATAVAVRDKLIVSVGSLESVKTSLGNQAFTIDEVFKDKIILPGLIDNHLHPAMAALILPMKFITPFEWRFPDREVAAVQGEKPYRRALQDAVAQSGNSSWFLTWGYHQYFHGDMSRNFLDSISADKPIIVWHRSFHELYANTTALRIMGIESDDVAGHHHVDFNRGHFYETGLRVAMAKLAPIVLAPKKFRQGLELTRKIVHNGGITTIADMAAGGFNFEETWPIVSEVFGAAPFRTLMVADGRSFGSPAGGVESLKRMATLQALENSRIRWLKQVKLFADGAFFSQLMQMNPPGYLDGHEGEWLMEPEELLRQARRFWRAGYQIHIHTNGDKGADVVIDVLETLLRETPRQDHRFTLHHLGYATAAQAKRLGELNAYVSAQPYYLYTLGEKYSEIGLGPDRAERIFLGQELLDAGVPISLHSDFTMAPAEPLKLAWVAANRLTASGKVLAPELKLNLDQALRAVTIEAARAIRMENQIGSIAPGKKADFTILNQDPYAVAIENLHEIPIFGTVFEGKIYPIQ
jgi:hypothetical protein